MPMKTCPQCSTPVGVRTLTCKCGFGFKATNRPLAIKPLAEARVAVTDALYDSQGLAALDGTVKVNGQLRPLTIIRLTAASLAAFAKGDTVPAIFDGQEVYLQSQSVEER
jgi:hypothetical protein